MALPKSGVFWEFIRKIAPAWDESGNLTTVEAYDRSFTETFLSIRTLGYFYGTSTVDGIHSRSDYLTALQQACKERIKDPIHIWTHDYGHCFFTPYVFKDTPSAVALGLIKPLVAAACVIGLIGLYSVSPVLALAAFCLPAVTEFITGIIGLALAGWHQAKAFCYSVVGNADRAEQEHDEAASYFLDATVRIVLAIPLAAVSAVATPLDLVRFVTRGLATIVRQVNSYASVPENESLPLSY